MDVKGGMSEDIHWSLFFIFGLDLETKTKKNCLLIGYYYFLSSPHLDVWELPKQDANFLTHPDLLPSIGSRALPVLVILIHPNADYAGKNILP